MREKAFLSFNLLIVAAVVSSFVLYGSSDAAEFSADMVQRTAQEVFKGKVFVKGNNFRQEINMKGEKQVTIFRQDKGVVWILMPEGKMYMEMHSLAQTKNVPQVDQRKIEKMAEKKHLGKEKVNGYVCDKYRYLYHVKGLGTMTQWFSNKLNFPIKMEMDGPSGHMITEYRNINEKRLSNSLFEVPPGYEKMPMPGMIPGMEGIMQRREKRGGP